MIKRVNPRKITFYQVLFIYREDWVVNENDLCFFSSLSLINVLYFIESDRWFKPKGLSPGGGFPALGLDIEALVFEWK